MHYRCLHSDQRKPLPVLSLTTLRKALPISHGSEAVVLDMTAPMPVHIHSGLHLRLTFHSQLLQLPTDGRVWSLLLEGLSCWRPWVQTLVLKSKCFPQFIFGIQGLALSTACELGVDRRVGYNAGKLPTYRHCSIPVTIVSSGHMGV